MKRRKNTYSTHENLLKAVSRHFSIQRAVEFGAGPSSTSLFLNKKFFPKLEYLISFESDDTWATKCRTDDPRHKLILCSEIFTLRAVEFCGFFDIALVDGKDSNWRLPTAKVASRIAKLVVIHDMENPLYKDIWDFFDTVPRVVDKRIRPWTVCFGEDAKFEL